MSIKHYKQIIKDKRKNTEFKQFIKEILSWTPLVFHRNNGFISRWPDTPRINICSIKEFDQNKDNLIENWIDYDFDDNFFENFSKLFKSINFPNFFHFWVNSNCDYSDIPLYSKNVYLSSSVIKDCENIFYSFTVRWNCNDIYNSLYLHNGCSNIYFSRWILKSYKVFYSSYINNSNNIWFSSNLTWCNECIFSETLENCSYYIENKKYEKEEYFIKKEEILKNKKEFLNYYKKTNSIWKNHSNINVKWNFITESEDVENWNYVSNTKNARNVILVWSKEWNRDFFDVCPGGGGWGNDFYWIAWGWDWSNNLYCSAQVWSSSDVFYSIYLQACSFCIWCIWLTNKSYCIFNKQYTKKDWEILAEKIFSQMDNQQILWDFFPWELNPFYFNDTFAWLIWWFKKEKITKDSYLWRDEKIKTDIPEWAELIKSTELNKYQGFDEKWNWKINADILNKVIIWPEWNYYKIVKMEYDFLVKHGLPIPEIHWMDRMKLNLGV